MTHAFPTRRSAELAVVSFARTASLTAGFERSPLTRAGVRPPNSRAASMPPTPNAGTPGTPDARSLSRPPAAPKLRFAPTVEPSPKSPKLDEAFRRPLAPVPDPPAPRADAQPAPPARVSGPGPP